jgi:alanine racemase
MSRIGFRETEEIVRALELIHNTEKIELEGVFTHFATADEADATFYNEQHEKFDDVLKLFPILPRYVHCSNTAADLWHKNHGGNVVRFGIGVYGLNPSGHALTLPNTLKPALRLESELVHVKKLPKGTSIGYGRTYFTEDDEWIGTVPIGYADGWIRKYQGFHVLVDGEFCPIVGRVCMDMFMIRLPKEYKPGQLVTLIGRDGDKEITLQDAADYVDTIHYEVSCLFSERITRIYQ